MNRREFLAASGAAAVSPLAGGEDADRQQQGEPEYYELRRYHMLPGAKQQQLHRFLSDVSIPAMNRLGVGPVGVFTGLYGPSGSALHVLLPHKSLASVGTLRARLAADPEYQRAGTAFLNAPMSDPAFVRVESSLMRAFEQMPKLEVPAAAAAKQPRIFELRVYESHSDRAAVLKVEMFNKGGEIPIFRRTGLTPVFFGETIVGPSLPNLTYMLVFSNMAERDKAWDAFRVDPQWKTLSANPRYADTVSSITDFILRPTAYSQI